MDFFLFEKERIHYYFYPHLKHSIKKKVVDTWVRLREKNMKDGGRGGGGRKIEQKHPVILCFELLNREGAGGGDRVLVSCIVWSDRERINSVTDVSQSCSGARTQRTEIATTKSDDPKKGEGQRVEFIL